jgi:formate dehydrogenase subunit delta
LHTGKENLEVMLNQLAAFFVPQSGGDQAAAAKAIASHLKLFWAPTMRRQLLTMFDAGQLRNSQPAAREALAAHRGELVASSARASSTTEVSPKGGGDAG